MPAAFVPLAPERAAIDRVAVPGRTASASVRPTRSADRPQGQADRVLSREYRPARTTSAPTLSQTDHMPHNLVRAVVVRNSTLGRRFNGMGRAGSRAARPGAGGSLALRSGKAVRVRAILPEHPGHPARRWLARAARPLDLTP
jgi:hypothetical protein